jgi:hypothetical protein
VAEAGTLCRTTSYIHLQGTIDLTGASFVR